MIFPSIVTTLMADVFFRVRATPGYDGFWTLVWVALGLSLLECLIMGVTLVALKWIVDGRLTAGQYPMWSNFVFRWDNFFTYWQVWASFMSPFGGTLINNWWLRLFGAEIGELAIIPEIQFTEPDLVHIGDHVMLYAHLQTHTFEDRVLKMDDVVLGPGTTFGAGSLVLYGARVGRNVHVLPHTLVMKAEALTSNRVYTGSPSFSMRIDRLKTLTVVKSPNAPLPAKVQQRAGSQYESDDDDDDDDELVPNVYGKGTRSRSRASRAGKGDSRDDANVRLV